MLELSPAERRRLKAQAHRLHPVVMIGDKGLTPAVLRELDVNLKSHELVKVKVASGERGDRAACMQQICEALDAAPVQHIGKVLVIYRENPDRAAHAPSEKTAFGPRPSARRRKTVAATASVGRPAAGSRAGPRTRTAPGRKR
jgi:RNA-binding protein